MSDTSEKKGAEEAEAPEHVLQETAASMLYSDLLWLFSINQDWENYIKS